MNKQMNNKQVFLLGMRDGIPIGLGYFAVAFALGIAGRQAGLSAFQGFLASFFTIASAGEYAAFRVIAENASYATMAVIILVTNARYLLMSCAMSQRLDPKMKFGHRVGMGALITDEIFGISMGRPGHLNPFYTYGAGATSVLPWALGTMFGVIMGNVLPAFLVNALAVALYGMFIAIIIPEAKKSRIIAGVVAVSFAVSFASTKAVFLRDLSEGTRIIVLTVVLAALAAVIFPQKEDEDEA